MVHRTCFVFSNLDGRSRVLASAAASSCGPSDSVPSGIVLMCERVSGNYAPQPPGLARYMWRLHPCMCTSGCMNEYMYVGMFWFAHPLSKEDLLESMCPRRSFMFLYLSRLSSMLASSMTPVRVVRQVFLSLSLSHMVCVLCVSCRVGSCLCLYFCLVLPFRAGGRCLGT